MLATLLKSVLLASMVIGGNCSNNMFKSIQKNHKHTTMTIDNIRYISKLTNSQYTNEVLDNILIPRVVGTANHTKVYQYIKGELKKNNWNIQEDKFEEQTPTGPKIFKNIIATLNPDAQRYLVLACHYDSKAFDDIVFVGATDSAVPCAMMLNLAKVMDHDLKPLRKANLSLKFIFFDGEEAFERWGPDDSIYGAKHLARVYHNNRQRSLVTNEVVSDLDKIDMLLLLDLIGHKGTRFLSCFENTEKWHVHLNRIEKLLASMNLLDKYTAPYFENRKYNGYIEDDHIPFLQKNVPILHLISIPFPQEWHTKDDDRKIIDIPTIENINKILRIFVAEYLHVEFEDSSGHTIPPKEL